MSIMPQIARMLLREHKHQRIEGDILIIGRQTVSMTFAETMKIIADEGGAYTLTGFEEIDDSTVGSEGKHYLTDRSFFSLFSGGNVRALDNSDYEGADIVHDLNAELPENLHGIADFIFDGSCLDNLFDPARALKSMSAMLRPSGRIMLVEHGTPIQSAYVCYSPDWFFDFFAINNYADCQIYICQFNTMQEGWVTATWRPGMTWRGQQFVSIVVAQKANASSNHRTPIQMYYRDLQKDSEDAIYRKKWREYFHSPRNLIGNGILEALLPLR